MLYEVRNTKVYWYYYCFVFRPVLQGKGARQAGKGLRGRDRKCQAGARVRRHLRTRLQGQQQAPHMAHLSLYPRHLRVFALGAKDLGAVRDLIAVGLS